MKKEAIVIVGAGCLDEWLSRLQRAIMAAAEQCDYDRAEYEAGWMAANDPAGTLHEHASDAFTAGWNDCQDAHAEPWRED